MTDTPAMETVEQIRDASRRMVRGLGFMGGPFAGTGLSPSAVHALIEIADGPPVSARDLAAVLRLDKSSVSRMLARLIRAGDLREGADPADGRRKVLHLTEAGQARVQAIHAFGRAQVSGALAHLSDDQAAAVARGLTLYAGALGPGAPEPVRIERGYRPGLIARITAMHIRYYSRESGFGRGFEAAVARGLAGFCDRLDRPANGIWLALRGEEILGSVALDAEDLGPGRAHLRWFILDDGLRGGGVGRRLLAAALAHADALGVAETHLWTFAGLSAARHLYETSGFSLHAEHLGRQWGEQVLEQHFIRPAPAG